MFALGPNDKGQCPKRTFGPRCSFHPILNGLSFLAEQNREDIGRSRMTNTLNRHTI